MGVFRFVLLCTTFLVPARTVYPGYFSYPAATGPIFPNVIPQFAAPPPVFAYSVYTPGSPSIVSAPAPMARSIYTEPDDTYRGYSFETEYEGGGKSNVVFVTGPQANQLLQKSIELFRSVVTPEIEQLSGRSANSNDTTNATVVETPSSTASAKSNSPIASHYHVQLYPAHTAPLLGPIMPFQNLVSSFAYSISNEIAASNKDAPEKAGEAQESMIHEVGSVVTAPPELLNKTSEEASHNSTESQENTPETSPQETTSTTVATTTTSAATTTIETTSASESSSESSNPPEESNEVDESNATTPGSDEIMETTSA